MSPNNMTKSIPYIRRWDGAKIPIARDEAAQMIRAHRLAHKKDPSWYEVYIDTYDNIKQIILYEPYENSHSIVINRYKSNMHHDY